MGNVILPIDNEVRGYLANTVIVNVASGWVTSLQYSKNINRSFHETI